MWVTRAPLRSSLTRGLALHPCVEPAPGLPLPRTASFGSNGLHQEESAVQVRARSPRCPEPKAPETLALARRFLLPPQLGMEAEGSSGSPVSDTGDSRTPESSNGQVC